MEAKKLFERIEEATHILVLSPHPDDESIAMGGFLSIYGRKCDVVMVTDGRHGHAKNKICNEIELIQQRREEIEDAMSIANVKKLSFLEIEDGKTWENRRTIYEINLRNYDLVFIPNRYENHIDHSVLYNIVKKMKKSQKCKCGIIEYEVWTPIRRPNVIIDITDVIHNKERMLMNHKSQLEDCDFVKKAVGLSCYRGMFIDVDYAEAFYYNCFILKEFIKKVIPSHMIRWLKRKKI